MLLSELIAPLEPTNEPYAIAKIAGIKLCESYNRQYGTDYRSVMPTNLYGIGDNYHPENSHVIPALIRRIHEAKINKAPEVTIWGTGTPRREFLSIQHPPQQPRLASQHPSCTRSAPRLQRFFENVQRLTTGLFAYY